MTIGGDGSALDGGENGELDALRARTVAAERERDEARTALARERMMATAERSQADRVADALAAANESAAATARRIEIMEQRARELEDALVRLTGGHDALVARARAVVDRGTADAERQIAAFESAIAATQASVFWRVKTRLARLLSRAPRRRARAS